jgi:FtsH-binding integral membrane protein
MKDFFLKTYFFWTISRIIFIVAAVFDTFISLPKALDWIDILVDLAILGYLVLMIFNTIIELGNKTRYPVAKYIAGVLSIVLAIVLFIVVMIYDAKYILLAAIFIAWIALLGVFDFLVMNRKDEEADLA